MRWLSGRSRGRPPSALEKLPRRSWWGAHFHIQTRCGYGHNRKSPAPAAILVRFEKITPKPRRTASPSRSSGCRAEKPKFLRADLLPPVVGRNEPASPALRYLL